MHNSEIISATDHILTLRNYPRKTTFLFAALEDVYERFGAIPEAAKERILEYFSLSVMPDRVPMSLFEETKHGDANITLCNGPFCQHAGAESLLGELRSLPGIIIQRQHCMGVCRTPPVAKVGKRLITNASISKVREAVECEQESAC